MTVQIQAIRSNATLNKLAESRCLRDFVWELAVKQMFKI